MSEDKYLLSWKYLEPLFDVYIIEAAVYWCLQRQHKLETSMTCADPEVDRGPDPPPHMEKHKAIGFLINTDLDPMENEKSTKPAFKVGPPSARQRNTI